MKIILCGYNWVGCKALDLLLEEGHEVCVYTHEPPYYVNSLIDLCKKRGVRYSTKKISIGNIPFKPDVICSIYYRYIIGADIIDMCNGRIFNLHPSLLPEYKGCSSITWAMIEGESYTGYSYHYLTEEVDGGNIILQQKIRIEDFDTQASIYFRVMFYAIDGFLKALEMVKNGFVGFPQDKNKGKYFKRGAPFDGKIQPDWDREKMERYVRAMIFPPLPCAEWDGKVINSSKDLDQYFPST